jgi:predicted PurR-regulated permease PerM
MSNPDGAPGPGHIFPPIARRTARLLVAIALVSVGVWIARDFLIPLGWAVILALALWPVYRLLTRWFAPGSIVLPLVFTLTVGLVLLVPLSFAAVEIGREGQGAAEWLRRARESGIPEPGALEQVPVIGHRVGHWWREQLAQPQQVGDLLNNLHIAALANWMKAFGAEFLSRAFVFFISMVGLFFLLRDGEWLGDRLLDHADRILGDPGELLARRMAAAARSTFNGTVLVAIGEGALIGVGYFLAGVPRPMLFTVFTIAFAMLPFGAWLAFTVASLVVLLQGGGPLFAILLFGWGAVVMLVGDNFVQPGLIGGAVRLPFLWALIGIFGGLETFGLLGLFLGPVIMAALMTIWREWVDQSLPRPRDRTIGS